MPAAVDVRLLRAAVFAAACVALAATGHLLADGGGVDPWTAALGWLIVFTVAAPLAGQQRRSLPAVAGLLAGAQLGLHMLFSLGHGSPRDQAAAPASAGGATGAAGAADGGDPLMALAAQLLCNEHAMSLTTGEAGTLVRNAGLKVPPPGHAADPGALSGAGAGHGASAHAAEGGAHTIEGGSAVAAALHQLEDPSMLAAHLLAAVLTGWLLLRGEAALWRLIRLSAAARPDALPLPRPLRLALAYARALAGVLAADPAPPRPRAAACHHPTAATGGTVLPDAVTRRGPPSAGSRFTLAA